MAHIVEFSIAGLAGKPGVYQQKLDRHVNIFFGPNGSGKTSLLRILDSAFNDDASNLSRVPFDAAEVHIFSVSRNRVLKRSFTREKTQADAQQELPIATQQDFQTQILYTYSVRERSRIPWANDPKPPDGIDGPLVHRYLPTSRLYLGYGGQQHVYGAGAQSQPSEAELDEYFARTLEQMWVSYSADILSSVRKAQEDGLASILKDVLRPAASGGEERGLEPEVAYAKVATFLKRQGSQEILGSSADFARRYEKDQKLRSVVSDINNVELQIEEALAPRLRLQSLIADMFSGKRVSFADKSIEIGLSSQRRIPLASLSSGEKHVLRLFIDAVMAQENSAIIDEPELSLHVDWQRRLVSSMTQLNPSTQLILATHSPEIMADVDESKIFKL